MKKSHVDSVKNQNRTAEQLRQLSRIYVQLQKWRNRKGNLLRTKFQYVEFPGLEESLLKKSGLEKDQEKDIEKAITKLLKQHPWSEYLLGIKGVGSIVAAGVIGELNGAVYSSIPEGAKGKTKAELLSWGRTFESTADLWSYAGLGVNNGKAAKRKKGEIASWNKYLKLIMFKFADTQIKCNGDYKKLYDEYKIRQKEEHPELSDGHRHRRAMRYIEKKFLSDIKHELIDHKLNVKNQKSYVK